MDKQLHNLLIGVLHEELVPALGCTEPVALAYAAAKAREVLGGFPDRMLAECSGDLLKNAKSVVVPPTADLKGVAAGVTLGAVGGNAERGLEALGGITDEHVLQARRLLERGFCEVRPLDGCDCLRMVITAFRDGHWALVEIRGGHTDIVRIERDGQTLFSEDGCGAQSAHPISRVSLRELYTFAQTVDLERVRPVLDRQIEYNMRIALEGLNGDYGASVGKTLIKNYGRGCNVLVKAYPAAGSDARMSGSALPVVINSGSGNQGMTASLPVIVYAEQVRASRERLHRALVLSNLIAVHQKAGLGKLSAFCGAVNAACGCGAAVTYLAGGSFERVAKTITNTIANVSGILCDGAKPSCAAKIASAVDAAMLGHYMAMDGHSFQGGDGLVSGDVDRTVQNFLYVGRHGMRQADREIIQLMAE